MEKELKINADGKRILDEMPLWLLHEVIKIKKNKPFHTSQIVTYFGMILAVGHSQILIDPPTLQRFCMAHYDYLADRTKKSLILIYQKYHKKQEIEIEL